MAYSANAAKDQGLANAGVDGTGLFGLIDRHRKAVLSSPFVLAAIMAVVYAVGGNEVRQVLNFMSPGQILGR